MSETTIFWLRLGVLIGVGLLGWFLGYGCGWLRGIAKGWGNGFEEGLRQGWNEGYNDAMSSMRSVNYGRRVDDVR